MNLLKQVRKCMTCLLCVLMAFSVLTIQPKGAEKVNLALHKPVTSTKIEGKANAENAVDGDKNTYWASVNPSELEIDLEGYYKISEINLMAYFAPSTGAVDRSYDYEIYGSIDQKEYQLLAEHKDGKLEVPEGTTFVISDQTARYIKVKILKTNAVNQPQNNTGHIKEISVYGEADPAYQQPSALENVAKGKDAYATENETGHGAALAVDGNTSTYWASGHPTFLEVDLDGYFDIEEITLLAYFNDGRYYNYEILTSLDGAEYKKVAEKKDTIAETAKGDTYSIEKHTARYVRVNMLSNSANPSVHISELKVMGTKNEEYIPPEEPEDKDNLAKGKPARSYSNNSAHPASAINDGDQKSYWTALYYPGYVDIDLESNYQLNKIQVIPNYADMSAYYQYSIYGSMDGSSFYKIAEKQDKEKVTKEGNTFDLSDVEARVVRVYLEYASKGTTGSINEVKVYGSESDTQVQERPEINVPDFDETEYAAALEEQESLEAVKGVLTRTIGAQYLDWFSFVLEENKESDLDYYELSDVDGKVQIKGNKGLSLTTGLNYYLKYFCNVLITQQSRQINMPDTMVPVKEVISKETPYEVRYAYNYCTHSYTMAFWGETQWQSELDYLALNGFNTILDITGQEEVWRRFLGEIGYSNDEIKDWLVGPSYYGWQFMANMENVNGPIPDSWFADRTELARKNQRQMRALGMTPVLQGYSGMVPNSIKDKDANAQIIAQGLWNGMQRPAMLKTNSDTFTRYADMFYQAQQEVYGDVSKYYATDPFHEGGNTGGIGRDIVGRRVLDEMKKADNDAVWVIQSWSFQTSLLQNISAEEKVNNILLLDLNGTKGAKYTSTQEFASSNWVYCMLENYGGRSGLAGNLEKYTHIPSQIKQKTKYMKGIGIAPEGTNNNPVKYDLFLEMMWEDEDIDLSEWIRNYVRRRYGSDSEQAQRAWELFLETTYLNTSSHADPPESIINARPQFNASKAAPNGNTNIHYSKTRMEKALSYLLEDYDKLKDSEGYLYDVTDFLRQAIANSAQEEYKTFTSAYETGNKEEFLQSSEKFLEMIRLQDEVLNANTNFMVGTWLAASEQASVGQDEFTANIFSMNAKAMVSSWAPYYCWGVYDYANREYGGLTKDYYLKRWEIWIDRLTRKLDGQNVSTEFTTDESHEIAWEWARSDTAYPTEATGDLQALYQVFVEQYALADQSGDASLVDQLDIKISTPLPAYSGSMGVEKAIDGNKSSIWSSAYGDLEPYDVYFEFAQPIKIDKFAYMPRPGGGNGNILGIELYGSDDGENYTKLLAKDTYANDGNEKFTSFEAVTAKYVKLHITDFFIYDNKHEIKSVTAAEFNFYKASEHLQSDVYTIENGVVSGVKEHTTVAQFLKQVNVTAGYQIIVERTGTVLDQEMILQSNDVIRLVKEGVEEERYTIGELEQEADFTPLNELIKDCETLSEADYTVTSWDVFSQELTTAIGVQVNPEASNKEIQKACETLTVAKEQLVSIKGLKDAIKIFEQSEAQQYTMSSWQIYQEAYEAAKAVVKNEKADKTEVELAEQQIQNAVATLVQRGDNTELKELLEQYKNEDLDESIYTPESWKAYQNALAHAEEIFKESADMDQQRIDEAIEELSRKHDALQCNVDFKTLIKAIIAGETKEAEQGFSESTTTASSWTAYQSALEEANRLLDNETAYQQDVDAATERLLSAIEHLTLRASDAQYLMLINLIEDTMALAGTYAEEVFAPVKEIIMTAQAMLDETPKEELTISDVKQALMEITKAKEQLHVNDMLHALQVYVNEANDILSKDLSAIRPAQVLNLQQAVANAQSLLDEDCIDETVIKQTMLQLMDAIQSLYKIVDKTNLQNLVDDCLTLHEQQYTDASWQVLLQAMEKAKTIIDDDDATVDEVQSAYDEVLLAIAELNLKVDKQALQLQLQITEIMLKNLTSYVPSTVKNLQKVYDLAKAIYEDEDASSQMVEEVTDALIAEMAKARLKADKHVLITAVETAEQLNMMLYTAESWAVAEAVIEQSKQILNDPSATQEAIDQAVENLQKALSQLKLKDDVQQIVAKDEETNMMIQQTGQPKTGDQTQKNTFLFLIILSAAGIFLFRKRRQHLEA